MGGCWLKTLLIQEIQIDKELNFTNLLAQNACISFLKNYNNKAIIIISKFRGEELWFLYF